MCDLGLSSELKLACNSALMKVVGPISLILDWLKYRESTTNRHIPYRCNVAVKCVTINPSRRLNVINSYMLRHMSAIVEQNPISAPQQDSGKC